MGSSQAPPLLAGRHGDSRRTTGVSIYECVSIHKFIVGSESGTISLVNGHTKRDPIRDISTGPASDYVSDT